MVRPVLLAFPAILVLGACSLDRTAHLTPLNDAARNGGGLPSIALAVDATQDSGPVTVALPGGNTLRGQYAIVPNTIPDLVSGPNQVPQGMSARHLTLSASDGRVTMHCDMAISAARHGAGECRTLPGDAAYDLVF